MDRMLLESFPYRVIEGMAIAARSIGAHEAVFYIRAEYPLAVERIREAIQRCEELGFAGKGILGTDYDLEFRVMEGAGAFVCGEETALINSMEGRRGTPSLPRGPPGWALPRAMWSGRLPVGCAPVDHSCRMRRWRQATQQR